MKNRLILTLAAATLLQPMAFADITYRDTSQITGGSVVGMVKMAGVFSAQARQAGPPTVSIIVIRGNRKALRITRVGVFSDGQPLSAPSGAPVDDGGFQVPPGLQRSYISDGV